MGQYDHQDTHSFYIIQLNDALPRLLFHPFGPLGYVNL